MDATHLLILFLLSSQLITMSLSSQSPQGNSDPDLPTLLKIKTQFGNPAALAEWQPGTDHCGWPYAYCNQYRRVVALFLENVSITSTLPPAIGELDQLRTINIVNIPGLHGPIPDSLGKLAHLSILNVMVTSVSGSIPASLSRTNLSSVSFFGNKLTGRIPTSLEKLPHLTFFDAANNDLVGTIPPRLVHGGTPDRPLGLKLSNNRLSGTIPWLYGIERYIMEFKVANNQLAGDASFLFGRRKTVDDLDLSGNRLRFNLTGLEMPRDLLFLNLSHNRIYGGVPASLLESRVVTLDLSYNELCGEIPAGGRMGWFKAEAYGHNKCLCGTPLPPCASGHLNRACHGPWE
ncbi:hypothetical protein PAHAL_7G188000 [Panicum hallii]|uniref:Leucine-rich repeat-containing N-terminal plant-type domain-containing protein n=1 Tax=Panicum hallii TaxID=206008 RepID=A0A2T8ICQ9_9POAL|nr:hypothetical protein PAHAL_7G188000 [Panicum hallii]